jgi:uncharacterized protein (TIGR02145 family)
MKFLLYILSSFLLYSYQYAQNITNVDFFSEGKSIMVTYDLTYKNQDTTFNFELFIISEKGEIIIPRIVSGDIRNVSPSKNKKIKWEILTEGISLSGRYMVEIKELKKYKTIKIGNQIWFSENMYTDRFRNGDFIKHAKTKDEWETASKNEEPAWCYYNNDPSTEVKFGKLYNWYAINDPRGLAPEGWFIPTNAEWAQLISNLGGEKVAGDKLKTKNGWHTVNGKSSNGTNESGFSAYPNCIREYNGAFPQSNSNIATFWSIDQNERVNTQVFSIICEDQTTEVTNNTFVYKAEGHPVRCFRDGTEYNQIIIGGKKWMKENLNAIRFRNGDPIPQATSAEDWIRAAKNKQPAWCYYENDPKNGFKYGIIYNGFAVKDSRGLAPQGWHVSNKDEWKILESTCGGNVSGRILTVEEHNEIKKSVGINLKSKTGWDPYYEYYRGEISGNGFDGFGFCGLPGGSRLPEKYSEYEYPGVSPLLFQGIGSQGVWWSDSKDGWNCFILSSKLGFNIWGISDGWGASVRCVRD